MKIGLIDVDGHNSFPNFALMRIAGYYKSNGILCEVANKGLFKSYYDEIYASKVFTFSKDIETIDYHAGVIHRGGTGYDIKSRLPKEIEQSLKMDYSIYPRCDYSVQFFSRGCIRSCPFCLVSEKEGYIHPVEPVELNPKGRRIEVLDNNFFANPKWGEAVEYLRKVNQPVNLHGVDVRIMDEAQAEALNSLKIKGDIHIAWDLPDIDLSRQIEAMTKYINKNKIVCYVLVGFNSTVQQDIDRLNTLKRLGVVPFVQPYRDFDNNVKPTQYQLDLAQWANKRMIFMTCDFKDFKPRKGFKCGEYLKEL